MIVSMAIKLAVTGGIASGKSLVGHYLSQHKGLPVIDADDVVHVLLKEDKPLQDLIIGHFGLSVRQADGSIDRTVLGRKVFGNQENKTLLESWIHPKTRKQLQLFYEQHAQSAPVVVSIIPLLFESSLESHYDEVWLIDSPVECQTQRLIENRGMSQDMARQRIAAQMSREEKQNRLRQCPSHKLLINYETKDVLLSQIDDCIKNLCNLKIY